MQVVSNLPFNISTDVVKLLLPMGDIFSQVVLLLQVKLKQKQKQKQQELFFSQAVTILWLILGWGSFAIGWASIANIWIPTHQPFGQLLFRYLFHFNSFSSCDLLCFLAEKPLFEEPEYNFRVPRENFFPQPKVKSTVLILQSFAESQENIYIYIYQPWQTFAGWRCCCNIQAEASEGLSSCFLHQKFLLFGSLNSLHSAS